MPDLNWNLLGTNFLAGQQQAYKNAVANQQATLALQDQQRQSAAQQQLAQAFSSGQIDLNNNIDANTLQQLGSKDPNLAFKLWQINQQNALRQQNAQIAQQRAQAYAQLAGAQAEARNAAVQDTQRKMDQATQDNLSSWVFQNKTSFKPIFENFYKDLASNQGNPDNAYTHYYKDMDQQIDAAVNEGKFTEAYGTDLKKRVRNMPPQITEQWVNNTTDPAMRGKNPTALRPQTLTAQDGFYQTVPGTNQAKPIVDEATGKPIVPRLPNQQVQALQNANLAQQIATNTVPQETKDAAKYSVETGALISLLRSGRVGARAEAQNILAVYKMGHPGTSVEDMMKMATYFKGNQSAYTKQMQNYTTNASIIDALDAELNKSYTDPVSGQTYEGFLPWAKSIGLENILTRNVPLNKGKFAFSENVWNKPELSQVKQRLFELAGAIGRATSGSPTATVHNMVEAQKNLRLEDGLAGIEAAIQGAVSNSQIRKASIMRTTDETLDNLTPGMKSLSEGGSALGSKALTTPTVSGNSGSPTSNPNSPQSLRSRYTPEQLRKMRDDLLKQQGGS